MKGHVPLAWGRHWARSVPRRGMAVACGVAVATFSDPVLIRYWSMLLDGTDGMLAIPSGRRSPLHSMKAFPTVFLDVCLTVFLDVCLVRGHLQVGHRFVLHQGPSHPLAVASAQTPSQCFVCWILKKERFSASRTFFTGRGSRYSWQNLHHPWSLRCHNLGSL